MMFLRLMLLTALLFFHGCVKQSKRPRIGVDSSWEGMNFGKQIPYVNGFIEDLLVEISHHEGLEFEKISTNGDILLSDLKEKKYDAAISSLPRYTFNEAKYDFSKNFLSLGPVLIVPIKAKIKKLSQIKDGVVGMVSGNSFTTILAKYPNVRTRSYMSIPDLLNAVADGEIAGALLEQIEARNYIGDLYAGQLKIGLGPLNDEGLHLIVEKGSHLELLESFDRSIEYLKKKKKMKALINKWSL